MCRASSSRGRIVPNPLQAYCSTKKTEAVRRKTPCFEHARYYLERGLIGLAIPDFKKTIERYPSDSKAHAYLGYTYSQKGLVADAALCVSQNRRVYEILP